MTVIYEKLESLSMFVPRLYPSTGQIKITKHPLLEIFKDLRCLLPFHRDRSQVILQCNLCADFGIFRVHIAMQSKVMLGG